MHGCSTKRQRTRKENVKEMLISCLINVQKSNHNQFNSFVGLDSKRYNLQRLYSNRFN